MHKIILSGNCNLNLSRKVENLNPFSRKYLKGFLLFFSLFYQFYGKTILQNPSHKSISITDISMYFLKVSTST